MGGAGRDLVIVRQSDGVLVQGITGRQGTFWTERMQSCGTKVVGGVNPRKAGTTHLGVPVYASAREAAAAGGFEASVMFIPPLLAKDAALDAIEAGAKTLVILTEFIPVHDVMVILHAARAQGCCVVGPNTAGLVTPGECFVGIMPGFNTNVFRPGRVGVISRSGSLGTLLCLNILRAGFGQSAFIGIGGDPVLGTSMRDALEALDRDARTDAVVIVVGEIGGSKEEEAAEYAAGMAKPVVAFIAGGASPPGKRMGHAGAIVMGARGTYASKCAALRAAGVTVLDLPSQVGEAPAQRSRLEPALKSAADAKGRPHQRPRSTARCRIPPDARCRGRIAARSVIYSYKLDAAGRDRSAGRRRRSTDSVKPSSPYFLERFLFPMLPSPPSFRGGFRQALLSRRDDPLRCGPSPLSCRPLDRHQRDRPDNRSGALCPAYVRDNGWLSPLFRAPQLQDQPGLRVLPGFSGAELGPARHPVVGGQPPAASPFLGHR